VRVVAEEALLGDIAVRAFKATQGFLLGQDPGILFFGGGFVFSRIQGPLASFAFSADAPAPARLVARAIIVAAVWWALLVLLGAFTDAGRP